jgi:hypothetical protein
MHPPACPGFRHRLDLGLPLGFALRYCPLLGDVEFRFGHFLKAHQGHAAMHDAAVESVALRG